MHYGSSSTTSRHHNHIGLMSTPRSAGKSPRASSGMESSLNPDLNADSGYFPSMFAAPSNNNSSSTPGGGGPPASGNNGASSTPSSTGKHVSPSVGRMSIGTPQGNTTDLQTPWGSTAAGHVTGSRSYTMDQNYLRKRTPYGIEKENQQALENKPFNSSADFQDPDAPPQRSLLMANFNRQNFDSPPPASTICTPVQATNVGMFDAPSWGASGEYWVTVFGFPAAAKDALLKKFHKLGEITSVIQGRGNWINLQFRTELQAELALSKDGEQMLENAIIGVKKCEDPTAFQAEATEFSARSSQNLNWASETTMRDNISNGPKFKNGNKNKNVVNMDILCRPKPANDICSKIMRFFGF